MQLQPTRRLAQPLAPRLGDQRDGGCREQSIRLPPSGTTCSAIRRRRERLARPARHHETAAIMVAQSRDRILDRFGLQSSQGS